jgi:hypothetical protein
MVMGTGMGMTGRSVRTGSPYLCLTALLLIRPFLTLRPNNRPAGNSGFRTESLFTCLIPSWAPHRWRRWRGRRAPALSGWSRRRDSATPAASGSSPGAARPSADATAAAPAAPGLKITGFFLLNSLSMF